MKQGKTSIITAMMGKPLKRKNDDDDDLVVAGDDDRKPDKKLALESLGEITLTPIPKVVEDKSS